MLTYLKVFAWLSVDFVTTTVGAYVILNNAHVVLPFLKLSEWHHDMLVAVPSIMLGMCGMFMNFHPLFSVKPGKGSAVSK